MRDGMPITTYGGGGTTSREGGKIAKVTWFFGFKTTRGIRMRGRRTWIYGGL